MQIKGYIGICGACFEPIREGEEIKFRESGSFFHRSCSEQKPNSYYLALERIRGQFEQGSNPTGLMNEMEHIFKIPSMNNESYNEDNEEVIKLYRELSDSRDFSNKDGDEMIKAHRIIFNTFSERYEMDGRELSSGVTLNLLDGMTWYSARIEYSEKQGGYYAIVFGKGEKDAEALPLRQFDFGSWDSYDLHSKEVQDALGDIE